MTNPTLPGVHYYRITFRCGHESKLTSPPPAEMDIIWCKKCCHYRVIKGVKGCRRSDVI